MTTIISRVFSDEKAAKSAAKRLVFRGIPSRDCAVIAGSDEAAVASRLELAKIDESATSAYLKAAKAGQAIVVVHATYKPLMAATMVRDTFDKLDTVSVGDVTEEYFVPDGPEKGSSVLREHPLFLTVPPARTGHRGAPVTRNMFRMLSPRKPRRSAIKGGGFKSRMFWPTPLLSKKPRKKSVISGVRYMSKAFWPMALLSKHKRSNSVITSGDLPFSRALGWPPVV